MEKPLGRGPVFVAGCPRSGTSALSWAIAAHRDYWTSAETHFFYYILGPRQYQLKDAFVRSAGVGSWLNKHDVDYPEFLFHLGLGLERLMLSRSGGKQWIDGSPENILVGAQLLQMFPEAQLFHVVRDPRAVCLSMLTSGFDQDWAHHLEKAVVTWNHYVGAGQELAARFPDRVLQIKQEDMAASSDAVAA